MNHCVTAARTAAAVLLVAACSSHPGPAPTTTNTPAPPRAAMPAPPLRRAAALSVDHAAERDSVLLEASGLAPHDTVAMAFGPADSDYRVVAESYADLSGSMSAQLRIPDGVEYGAEYVFVILAADGAATAQSDAIVIAPTGGSVRVRGRFAELAPECPPVRSASGKLYALVVPIPLSFEPGIELVVSGKIAPESCCAPVTTLQVVKLTRVHDVH